MLEKKFPKEIILNVEKNMSSYEIIETIPFSTDSDLMGMYIKDMSNAEQNLRLSKEAQTALKDFSTADKLKDQSPQFVIACKKELTNLKKPL